jgi:hypothetical protein
MMKTGGMVMKLLLSIFIMMILSVGCSTQKTGDDSTSASYPSAVFVNNILYGLSVEIVTQDKLGIQLGVVKRKVEPMPTENGESNEAPVGSKIYEIKSVDPSEAIAVEIYGEYRKASKM